jgi:nitric oxide reductase large subunit
MYVIVTHTAPLPAGLSDGAVAAIVVVIILLSVAVGVLLVIAIMLYMRWRVRTVDLPPPNRKGSMRLVIK